MNGERKRQYPRCPFLSELVSYVSLFDYARYQLMLNCWNEFADNRPTFPDLVREFDRMITMLSDKVNVRLCKNNSVIYSYSFPNVS